MSSKHAPDPVKYTAEGFILRNNFLPLRGDFLALEKTQYSYSEDGNHFGIHHWGCQGDLSFVQDVDRPQCTFVCCGHDFGGDCEGVWRIFEIEAMSLEQLQKTFYISLPDFDWECTVLDEASNQLSTWTYSRPGTIHEVYARNQNTLDHRRRKARGR